MQPQTLRVWMSVCCALWLALGPLGADAIMAGAEPDSPAVRVDPNRQDSPWAGVVAVRVKSGVYSGVIVSPRHVLTAAHVASGAAKEPQLAEVVLNIGAEPKLLAVSQVQIFPTYAFPYDDLALLTLAEQVPEDVPVYPLNDLPYQPGEAELVMVGYGGSGHGDKGVNTGSSAQIKRVGWNMMDAFAASIDNSGRKSSFYLYDFDGPEGSGPMGGPTLGNERESVVAGGDSGSPAFVIAKYDYRAVAGINTFATPLNSAKPLVYGFGQGGGGMLIAEPRFLQWLDEASGGAVKRVSSLREPGFHWPWWLGGGLFLGALGGFAGRRFLRA